MSTIVLTVLGLVARHLLTALGAAAVAAGLPSNVVTAMTNFFTTLGPVEQIVGGVVLLAAGLLWSWWQKKKSGVLPPKS